MKATNRVIKIAVVIALLSLCVGCDYYKEQMGYLVIRSGAYDHHYEGSPCGLQGKLTCDLPEMRYTLIHRGVEYVTNCQSWDERNKCGQLQVGEAYKCSVGAAADEFGPSLLSCGDDRTLGIEHSEQK